MSPDAYAAAARAEATRHFVYSPQTPSPQDLGEHIAVWARTYLEAQEPTDAEIEAAAITLCASAHHERVWAAIAEVDPARQDRLRADARAALAAARNARQGS